MAKQDRNRKKKNEKAAHMREVLRLKRIAKKEHNENIENNNIVLNKIPEVVIYSDDIVKTKSHNIGILNVQCPSAVLPPASPIPPDPSTPIDRC